jgi:hypothetical protein
MRQAVSSALPSCVVDTVVLLYFLLAGEADLLMDNARPAAGNAPDRLRPLMKATFLTSPAAS